MTNKEELIKQELGKYALRPEHVYHGTNAIPAAFHKAMDEYAKQQAIAFDVWKRVNLYTLDYPNNRYIKLIILPGDKAKTEMVPVDDVYSQFIEQQNK